MKKFLLEILCVCGIVCFAKIFNKLLPNCTDIIFFWSGYLFYYIEKEIINKE